MKKTLAAGFWTATMLLAASAWADRLVPVDPLLDFVDADKAEIRFFDDRDGTFFTRSYGALPEGRHEISVERGGLTNRYAITARKARNLPPGRRLNNFVSELLSADLKDGEVSFVNPREGWVFIGFDRPHRGASACLDGAADPAVVFREGEPSETMRWLKDGAHRLTLKGTTGGRLVVRSIPSMKQTARTFANETTDVRRGREGYGWDFFRRWLIPNYNIFVVGGGWKRRTATEERMVRGNKLLAERGKRLMAACDIRPFRQDELRADYAKMRTWVCGSNGVREGIPLEVDEHQVNAGKDKMDAFAEATWAMAAERPDLPMLVDYCDLPWRVFTNFTGQASSISAALNTGGGHGMLVPEMYLGAMRSEEKMLKQEEFALAYVEALRSLMPSAPSRVMHLMNGWLTLGDWTSHSSSEVDLKYVYDHYVWRLATDPKFHDAGGVGMSTLACNEEMARWVARLVRHYCIEGRTDFLSERLGYRLRPEIVKNGDFMDGDAGWTLAPAEGGSVRTARRERFGGKVGQCRMQRDTNREGEFFAAFTRSAKGPNRLFQRVTGLVPGKCYALTYAFADLDDVEKPGSVEPDEAFGATLSCAAFVDELFVETKAPSDKARAKAKKEGQAVHCVNVTRRFVFRATATEGELVFSDWKGAADPGGAPGRRHLVNYIGICPYYLESEAELEELKALAAGPSLGVCSPSAAAAGTNAASVRIVAHQGLHGNGVPGNTVEAIAAAYSNGWRAVETDFWRLEDGSFACMHDPKSGARLRKPYRIPNLDEVLACVPTNGVLQCEIKGGYGEAYATEFMTAVKRAGLGPRQITVSSASAKSLTDFHRRFPEYRTIWLLPIKTDFDKETEKIVDIAKKAGFFALCPNGMRARNRTFRREHADAMRANGFDVRLWGVHTPGDFDFAVEVGASAVTSDCPAKLAAYQKSKSKVEP